MKQNYLKSFCARFLTLLVLALMSTNLAWGETKTLTFSLTSNPGSWPTANSTTLTNYTYTLDETSYTFGLKNVKCNSGYLMLTSTAVLGLPAIDGYKLTKVAAKNSSGCSTSTKVGISSSSSSASYISGGAIQTWSTKSSTYTYNLSGTSENTVYYLYVTNANAQIIELALTYEATGVTHGLSSAVSPEDAGTVTLGATTVVENKTTTATATPAEGYNFTSWSITGAGASLSSTTANPTTVTMGTADATVTANFTEKAKYSITYTVNGESTTIENVYAGTVVSTKLPVPSSGVSGYVFKGWVDSPIDGVVQSAPDYYDISQGISANLTLYAVFAYETKENVAFSKYEKVISAPADWSGKYLLSTGNITFTGQNGTNAYGAYAEIEPGTTEQTLYEVEVAKTTNGYSMYHDGKYLGQTSNDNRLDFNDTFISTNYEWTFDTQTGAKHGIISVRNSDYALKYNSGSPRFACYTTAQTHVYMYKRIETGTITYSDYCTTINIEAGNVTFEVGEGATFKKNDTFTAQETTVKPGTYTNLPSASKPLYTFEGWYLSTDVNQEVVSSITVADGDDLTYVAKWQGLSISNIEDVTTAGDYKVEGTVVATTEYGFVVGDATGFAYVNTGNLTPHGKVVGDKVTVLGSVSESAGVLIFKSNLEISEAVSSTYDSSVEPTTIDAAALVALLEEKQTQYVEYVGDLSYSGSYYNIAVKGTNDAYGRIYSATTEELATLTGILGEKSSAEVKVKGYYVGVGNNKYANTILGTIEAYTIPTHNLTVNIDGEGCNVNVQINSVNQKGVNGVYTIKDGEIVSLVQKKAEHFNFVEWTSEDITISDAAKTVSPLTFSVTKDITVNASFEEDAYNTITWNVVGNESTEKYYEGSTLKLPVEPNPEELGFIDGYVFMGWSNAQVVASDGTDFTPIVAGGEVEEDATYYAVFAYRTGEAGAKETVTLTNTTITGNFSWAYGDKGKTLKDDKNNDWTFDGTYHQNGGNLQLGQNSGLGHTPTFDKKIKSITFEVSVGGTRYLQLKSGDTNVGDLNAISENKEYTFNIDGDYYQLDFANYGSNGQYSDANNAINIKSIKVVCANPDTYEYSNYCTTIPPRTFTKTISNRKMATLYLDYAVEIPEDVKAYTAADKDDSHTAITLEKITDGVIPANTGVIVYADVETNTSFDFVETATTKTYDNNCLKGVIEKTVFNAVTDYDASTYNYYALMADGETSVVFKLVSGGSYAANSAYLVLPKTANAKVDFTFGDEVTGIESLQPSTLNPQPSQYNLNGMKVNNNYKGIVIMNGKKYINK